MIVALLGLLLPAIALAGTATLSWTNAANIAGSEVAIGTCDGEFYGKDVPGDYARIPPDRSEALILRLEQGEVFCFRVRHISKAGVPGPWLFLGKKKIPLDEPATPPTLPPPPRPKNGKVT